jgi:hypothetical protein
VIIRDTRCSIFRDLNYHDEYILAHLYGKRKATFDGAFQTFPSRWPRLFFLKFHVELFEQALAFDTGRDDNQRASTLAVASF